MKKFVIVLMFSMILISGCFKQQVQKSIKSVVHISCPQWQGSGFVIDEHIIGTARHVTDKVEDFEITLYNGKKIHATRAISAKSHDVAFIWVDEELPKECIAELASIKDCSLGQEVYSIGSPYGKINFNSVTKGIISGLDRDWDMIDPWTGERYGWEVAFTTDSANHPGNSGCPIFTMDGKVRGILVGGFSPVLNCSMPVDLFLDDLEEIKRMFVQDKYQFEEQPDYRFDEMYNWYQNEKNDTRLDELWNWFIELKETNEKLYNFICLLLNSTMEIE